MFGWRPDSTLPDRAAHIHDHPNFADMRKKIGAALAPSPSSKLWDWRPYSPILRHDQGQTGSCVANSTTRALENKRIQQCFALAKQMGMSDTDAMASAQSQHVPLSRLALYYLCREMMSPQEISVDSGTSISLAAQNLQSFGISRETADPTISNDNAFWPWDVSKIFVSPTWSAMRDAYQHRTSSWARITSVGNSRIDDVIAALSVGNVVVFGTTVDNQWMNYTNGTIGITTGTIIGRHATLLCGWDPSGFFWDENSWGSAWGTFDGFCRLTPEVISNVNSDDFIVLESGYELYQPR